MSACNPSQEVLRFKDEALATLFGVGSARDRFFDCAASERAAVDFAEKMIAVDYKAADFIRESLRSATRLRARHSIPQDLGFVRESLRIARKIFGRIEGKKIFFEENHEQTRAIGIVFLHEGAIQVRGDRRAPDHREQPDDPVHDHPVANIAVIEGYDYPECDVVFAMGSEKCARREAPGPDRDNPDKRPFLFTGDDLEAMTRDEMRRWYPPGFADILEAESKKIQDELARKWNCDTEERLKKYLLDHNMDRYRNDRSSKRGGPAPRVPPPCDANDVHLILDLLDQAFALERQQSRSLEQ